MCIGWKTGLNRVCFDFLVGVGISSLSFPRVPAFTQKTLRRSRRSLCNTLLDFTLSLTRPIAAPSPSRLGCFSVTIFQTSLRQTENPILFRNLSQSSICNSSYSNRPSIDTSSPRHRFISCLSSSKIPNTETSQSVLLGCFCSCLEPSS